MNKDMMLICNQTPDLEEFQIILEDSGIAVTRADRTQGVITSMLQHNPAFVLLDLDIENSEHFLQTILKSTSFDPPPYILIAATISKDTDRTSVWNLGADACIEKPISPQEVLAFVHSVLRREHKAMCLQTSKTPSRMEYKDLTIDSLRRIVTMRGKLIALSPKEFDILNLLAKHAGTILTRKVIYETVWNEKYVSAATRVTRNVHSLRLKLGLNCKDTDYIQTVHGIGYRFTQLE